MIRSDVQHWFHSAQHRLNRRLDNRSGTALLEFVFVFLMLIVLLFGLIDFGRAIYERQVMVNISREGSNLAARGKGNSPEDVITNAVDAVIASAQPLSISTKGCVTISAVFNDGITITVSNQVSKGFLSGASKIGPQNGPANIPATTPVIPQPGKFMYVTEVFYNFTPITPIGKLLNIALPSQLYDAAYF